MFRTLALCCLSLAPAAAAADCVVLLHGLARSDASLLVMDEALTHAGYRVINADYPSTQASVGALARDYLGPAVRACGRWVTIEDPPGVGGMGAQISHALSQAGIPHKAKTLGIPGEFGQSAYLAEQLYQHHGLTTDKMVEAAKALR